MQLLTNSILYSIVLHVVVVIWLTLFATMAINPEVSSTEITFVRLNSNSVKNSGTPEQAIATVQQKAPEVKKVEKPPLAKITKADPAKSLNQKTKTNTNPVIKPKQDNSALKGALAGIEQEVKQRDKADNATSGNGGAGNITADDPSIAQYRATVKSRVVRNLVWPGGTGETVLITKISFRLSASGGLISASFGKTSGNGAFDAACMRAVQNASPFPPPPEGAITQGFVVEFRKRI